LEEWSKERGILFRSTSGPTARAAAWPRFRGRGGGPGNAARQAQDNSDNEWLAQIYGQHTIYRRDEGAAIVNAKAEASEVKEPVAA